MESETIQLARIMHGEAISCYNVGLAFLAIAYVYQRNKNWSGYYRGEPDLLAVVLANFWMYYPDPTEGARFMFSSEDLKRSRIARKIARDRGPPTLVLECDPAVGAGYLLFYR